MGGIKKSTLIGIAATARPTVQKYNRRPGWVARFFNIKGVYTPSLQLMGRIRFNWGKKG
jgi:hypothetical protein